MPMGTPKAPAEVSSTPCEVLFHPPEVRQWQRVDEVSDIREVTERPAEDVHLVGDAGSVDVSVVPEGVIARKGCGTR
jgi:hypothetical protein